MLDVKGYQFSFDITNLCVAEAEESKESRQVTFLYTNRKKEGKDVSGAASNRRR